jgi:N-acetyl-alpha-D-glucosaminyl L-malate synthase BshA
MKIGVTCYPTYGGSGAVATSLGIELAKRGHEVHFVSYAQPFRLAGFHERVFFHEVEMEQYPLFEHPPYTLALAVALHDAARTHELDLIHVHYAIPHATSAWIAQQMLADDGPPMVTTLHGTDITLVGIHPSFQAITSFSILKSQGITTVSKFLKDQTVRDFGVAADAIEVIPNFLDTDVYVPDKKPCHRHTLADPGEKILMHVSNFRPVKRVHDVVSVFAGVAKEMPARLIMIGDGPERIRAIEKAKALGVEDRVVFLGKHSAVEELLPCADLFLLPSESESFGLAALEAMASGTPVVATQVGGLPEVVPHGEAGYLLAPGDVAGMTAGALEILSDADRSKAFGEVGRAVALERFSAEGVVPLYEDYCRAVVETHRAGSGSRAENSG